jgi:hypothetical protein
MTNCENGTTTEEPKVVAEQYRGTFKYISGTTTIVLTENTITAFSYPAEPAYTEGSDLYVPEISKSRMGYFTDVDTLEYGSEGNTLTYKRV